MTEWRRQLGPLCSTGNNKRWHGESQQAATMDGVTVKTGGVNAAATNDNGDNKRRRGDGRDGQ